MAPNSTRNPNQSNAEFERTQTHSITRSGAVTPQNSSKVTKNRKKKTAKRRKAGQERTGECDGDKSPGPFENINIRPNLMAKTSRPEVLVPTI
jgi:hypothetical protein